VLTCAYSCEICHAVKHIECNQSRKPAANFRNNASARKETRTEFEGSIINKSLPANSAVLVIKPKAVAVKCPVV
jgi:hypothetical protein